MKQAAWKIRTLALPPNIALPSNAIAAILPASTAKSHNDMGLLSIVKQWYRARKSKPYIDKLSKATAPIIGTLSYSAVPIVLEKTQSWNLENQTLLTYLGYVAGILAHGEKTFVAPSNCPIPPQEFGFTNVISNFLNKLPGSSEWLDHLEKKMEQEDFRLNNIADLCNSKPAFNFAFQWGQADFAEFLEAIREGDRTRAAVVLTKLDKLLSSD